MNRFDFFPWRILHEYMLAQRPKRWSPLGSKLVWMSILNTSKIGRR